jgi:Mn-dependent DtxR family transcriptional regulator
VRLSQIQNEVISAAHSEGRVHTRTFAALLGHGLDEARAAIDDLVNRGLLAPTGGEVFRLTEAGDAVNQAREEAHRAAVVSRTQTWG